MAENMNPSYGRKLLSHALKRIGDGVKQHSFVVGKIFEMFGLAVEFSDTSEVWQVWSRNPGTMKESINIAKSDTLRFGSTLAFIYASVISFLALVFVMAGTYLFMVCPIIYGAHAAITVLAIMVATTINNMIVACLLFCCLTVLPMVGLYTMATVVRDPVWQWIDILRGENGTTGKANFVSGAWVTVITSLCEESFAHELAEDCDALLAHLQHWVTMYSMSYGWLKAYAFGWVLTGLILVKVSIKAMAHAATMLMSGVIVIITGAFWWRVSPYKTMWFATAIIRMVVMTASIILKCARRTIRWLWLAYLRTPLFRHNSVGAAQGEEVHINIGYIPGLRLIAKMMRLRLVLWTLQMAKSIGVITITYGLPTPRVTFRSIMVAASMQLTHYINELDPPVFIRNILHHKPGTFGALNETIEILRELGYPVDPETVVTPDSTDDILHKYDLWVLAKNSVSLGIRKLKIFRGEEFELVKDLAIPFKYSDEYVTIENELQSVSRYFVNAELDMPITEDVLDSVWELTKHIFEGSRITPLYSIWKNWNKRFNFGPLATHNVAVKDRKGRLHLKKKKLRRTEYIASFPSVAALLKHWHKLYRNFPGLTTFANAFPKSESLPPKKWQAGKLRTPVSSFLPQYLFQMVFSYEPNHRYDPFAGPAKNGIPVNGTNMARVFERHARLKYHYAGDMEEFDSKIVNKVLDAIKSIRKRGFKNHKMFDTICNMVDITYDSIATAKLTTPSTGKFYKKGGGLMTGHGSTSNDNSLATIIFYMTAWHELTGRSAHDFKNFNELSCYGDDHILSISENAPKVWTFDNIRKTMAKWGINVKDEVPTVTRFVDGVETTSPREHTDLDALPFLSKFSRVPTSVDKEEWKSVFPHRPIPSRIVYHNYNRLLSKAAAGSKTRDPDYRIERLIGYLYLTSHHKGLYMTLREMIDTIVKNHPKATRHLKTIPSYERVLEVFYDPNSKPKPFDEGVDEEEMGLPIVYGKMSTIDYILNYLSYIPDVLNPRILEFGFARMSQELVKDHLQWPKELLQSSNQINMTGSLVAIINQTPYNFIIDQSLTTVKNNYITLLVRHWLFCLFSVKSYSLDPFALLDKLAIKIGNFFFILRGEVPTKFVSFSTPIWNTLLVLLLDFVHVPEIVVSVEDEHYYLSDMIPLLPAPDIGVLASRAINFILARVWDTVPPNYRELEFLGVPRLPGTLTVITAGTATGKSTSMAQFLQLVCGHNYNKIIYIEPRSEVVKGLVNYMQGLGFDCSGGTTGLTLDKRAKVWYVTAQEAILVKEVFHHSNLLVIDEAHLDEPAYNVIKQLRVVRGNKFPATIYTTATPDESWRGPAEIWVDIPSAKTYQVVDLPYNGGSPVAVSNRPTQDIFWEKVYLGIISGMLSNRPYTSKFLVFATDVRTCDFIANNLPCKTFVLTSKTKQQIPSNVDVIVTTSVADVAITIPGVTHVVTPNFVRMVQNRRPFEMVPEFVAIDAATVTQRRGRTGRTNNGSFTMVNFTFTEDAIRKRIGMTNIMRMALWALEGMPIEVLLEAHPQLLHLQGEDLTRTTNHFVFFLQNSMKSFNTVTSGMSRIHLEDIPRDYAERVVHLPPLAGVLADLDFSFMAWPKEYVTMVVEALEAVCPGLGGDIYADPDWASDATPDTMTFSSNASDAGDNPAEDINKGGPSTTRGQFQPTVEDWAEETGGMS